MVMLIDDDKDDCEIFCEAVRRISNCECFVLHSATEGLLMLKQMIPLPACIFIDLDIPVMNGITLLKLLKQHPRLSDIPVIIYSQSIDPADIDMCKKLGAKEFLNKTNDFQVLVSSLAQIKEAMPLN